MWGLHQKINNKYRSIAKVEDTGRHIAYLTTFKLLASTMVWVNMIDRTLFTSYDNQPSRVDMKYVNTVVFSIFLVHQFLFWFLIKPHDY